MTGEIDFEQEFEPMDFWMDYSKKTGVGVKSKDILNNIDWV